MNEFELSQQKQEQKQIRIFSEADLEVFTGELEQRMRTLVEWINQHVRIVKWSNEDIDRKFVKRSAQKILTDGDTCYMNPCSDLTLVAYALLKRNGFTPLLVVEELIHHRYNMNHLHFALEFINNKQSYFLEFVTLNQAILKQGKYAHQKPGITTLQIKRISEDIGFDQAMTSVLSNFQIQGFQIERVLQQLKKDNTDQTYERYRSGLSHAGKLYLDVGI